MDDMYCYPGTSILRNKLDIRYQEQLLNVEIRLASVRLYQLQEHPIQGKFDLGHLCSIHQHIFQDLYLWAGQIRKVNIAKTNMFCLVQHIRTYSQSIFPAYHDDCMRMKDDAERFIQVFVRHYADLNALHPFREGNGRAQRAFAQQLCLKCGYVLDLSKTGHKEMLSASITSFNEGNNTALETIFRKCIKPLPSA